MCAAVLVLLLILTQWAARAQPPDHFEVASIRPSNAGPGSSGIKTGHGRLDAANVTLKRCIMGAYGVGPHQSVGGPDWLDADRFDILAKADQPVDDDTVLMRMLRQLLADRFQLALRRDSRMLPAFLLEVAKNGPKLERAAPGEARTNTSRTNAGLSIQAHLTDMDGFAGILARQTTLPVVNRTGLQGVFNFNLTWRPDNAAPERSDLPSLFTAIREQLGLRLRSEKAPVEVLVVERAEKPSAN